MFHVYIFRISVVSDWLDFFSRLKYLRFFSLFFVVSNSSISRYLEAYWPIDRKKNIFKIRYRLSKSSSFHAVPRKTLISIRHGSLSERTTTVALTLTEFFSNYSTLEPHPVRNGRSPSTIVLSNRPTLPRRPLRAQAGNLTATTARSNRSRGERVFVKRDSLVRAHRRRRAAPTAEE